MSECTKEEWRSPELVPKPIVRDEGGNHVKTQIMLRKAQPHNHSRTCQEQTVSHDMQVCCGSSIPRERKSVRLVRQCYGKHQTTITLTEPNVTNCINGICAF